MLVVNIHLLPHLIEQVEYLSVNVCCARHITKLAYDVGLELFSPEVYILFLRHRLTNF